MYFTAQKLASNTSASLCVIQAWSLPLGLTLIFGTVTAKTWHIFLFKETKIFATGQDANHVVLLLAAVDIILCSVWTKTSNSTFSNLERITEDNLIEVKVECYSEYYSYYSWFGALIPIRA